MFDKLDDLLRRYEEIMNELHEPDVANDQTRFRKLMKEQSDLTPIVEAYTEYKNVSRMWKIPSRCWKKKMTKKCVRC